MTALAAACVAFLTVAGQGPVDFSGTWIRDADRSSATGGGRGAGGGNPRGGQGGGLGLGPAPDTLVHTQNTQTLSIEEHRGGGVSRVVYRLDGFLVVETTIKGQPNLRRSVYARPKSAS